MTYEEITSRVSDKLGIPFDVFKLDYKREELKSEQGIQKSELKPSIIKTDLEQVKEIGFKFVLLEQEKWEGVILYLDYLVFKECIGTINVLLLQFNQTIINLNKEKSTYHFPEVGFPMFSVYVNTEKVELHFAKCLF